MSTDADVVVELNEDQLAQQAEQEAYQAEMAMDVVDVQAPAEPEAETEKVEEAIPERKEMIQGYTEAEIRDALAALPKMQKAIDTTAGTFGSRLADQQRVIEQLQQQLQQKQGTGQLSAAKLTRLSQEFPEIAEMLAEDLNGVIGTGGFDPAQVDQYVTPKMRALEERMEKQQQYSELKALNRSHRDWREIAAYEQKADGSVNWNNPVFGKWVAGQGEEVRQQLIQGWDADYISERLSEFKESTKVKAVKNKSLEAAVIPRGLTGRSVISDDDEEDAAYRAEMARR